MLRVEVAMPEVGEFVLPVFVLVAFTRALVVATPEYSCMAMVPSATEEMVNDDPPVTFFA